MPISTSASTLASTSAPTTGTNRPRLFWILALAVLAGLSLLIAGFDLGNLSFWYDEAYSANAAHLPASQLWDLSLHVDPHTAVWHTLLKGWYGIYDGGEAWGRLPALVFGAGTVVVAAEVARRLFNERAAIAAGVVLLFNTGFTSFEQEARPYTFAAFLTVVGMLQLVRFSQRPTNRNALLAGVAIAVALYAHPFCALAFVAVLPAYLFGIRKVLTLRKILLGLAAFAVVAAPFIVLLAMNRNSDNLSWLPDFSLAKVKDSAYFVTGTKEHVMLMIELVLIAIGIAVTAVRKQSDELRSIAFVLSWLLLMPIIAFVADAIHPLVTERYLIPATPAFAIMLGFAIDAIARISRTSFSRTIALGVTAALLFSYAWKDNRTEFKIQNNWRDAMSLIAEKSGKNDTILAHHADAAAIHYGAKHGATRTMIMEETGKPIIDSRRPAAFKEEPVDYTDVVKSLRSADHDVWLVSVIDAWDQQIRPFLEDANVDSSRLEPIQTERSIRIEVLHPAIAPVAVVPVAPAAP